MKREKGEAGDKKEFSRHTPARGAEWRELIEEAKAWGKLAPRAGMEGGGAVRWGWRATYRRA